MITLDGSCGEGGGQILRTALGLSLVTGEPFTLERIRSRRKRPGLRQQHLTAVLAAAEVGQSEVEGAYIGSSRLVFRPREVRFEDYTFSVGTAGSATLVFQAILPALLRTDRRLHVAIEGGTHNPWAPPLDFVERAFLPILARMGSAVESKLHRHGFFPAGGGRIEFCLGPVDGLRPIELLRRGRLRQRLARAIVSRLPRSIADRQLRVVGQKLGWPSDCLKAEDVASSGPGNVVLVEADFENVTEVFAGFGEKGVPAERVAGLVVREASTWLEAEAAVGPHLADQLLVFMALAGGGRFTTLAPTTHTRTNIEVICRFLDVRFTVQDRGDVLWEIDCRSRGA